MDEPTQMVNLLLAHSWASSSSRVAVAVAVTVSFALLALGLRGVNRSGALAGGAVCLLLFISCGPPAFATLVILYLLTWLATRVGFRSKQKLGVAERREGRSASQVWANLGVAAACAVLAVSTGDVRWWLAMAAGLAEAATDTVASEIGQSTGRKPVLITTWQPVPAGTDGGVTLTGTMAGTVAGLIVASVAAVTGLFPVHQVWIPATAGTVGMLADSFLGATFQRRGLINNDGVNLVSTAIAAALTLVLPQ